MTPDTFMERASAARDPVVAAPLLSGTHHG